MTEEQQENFCHLPFVQLLLQPTGVISPCCWMQEMELGKVPDASLTEIWNGEEIRELRREFLSGNPVKCKTNMSHIGCHRFNRGPYTQSLEMSEYQKKGPRRLDLRLNGRCNLQCIMCDVWKQPNGVYDQAGFWDVAPTEIFPHLMEIDVLGGEPFVQQDTFRLIEEIYKVNQACTWAFVSNGNYNFKQVRKHIEKLAIRWFMLSLDSVVPETYAKIRKGGNLARALETIDGLAEFRVQKRAESGHDIDCLISMCVQKDNWREMEQFLTYCRSVGIRAQMQFAYGPAAISLITLGHDERREIRDYAARLHAEYGAFVMDPILKPISDSLREELADGPML